MSKFNTTKSPVLARTPDTTNLAGATAFSQSPELELASILLNSKVQDQFYRSADDTLGRLRELVTQVDPEFAAKAAIMARDEFGMRSITHALAAELAGQKRTSGHEWAKVFYDRVVVRADDMTEIVSYLKSRYGIVPTNAMKKGFAKAFDRLDAYKLAKYRGENKETSLVDIVNLVHPAPTSKNRKALKQLVEGKLRNTDTWESKLSASGGDEDTKNEAWAELLGNYPKKPHLGYFALLRNLRNIEQTGDRVLIDLAARQLVDDNPGAHRIHPVNFLTAFQHITHPKLLGALSGAIDKTLANVPEFDGETLIVIDHSGSMGGFEPGCHQFTGDMFAASLFKANGSDVMVFGTDAGYVTGLNPADSVLTNAQRIGVMHPPGGHGTNLGSVFQRANKSYQRFIVFSDMQSWQHGGGYWGGSSSPATALEAYQRHLKVKPFIYSFDLAGYGSMQFPQERVIALAGLSEKIFDTMKSAEESPDTLVKRIMAVEF